MTSIRVIRRFFQQLRFTKRSQFAIALTVITLLSSTGMKLPGAQCSDNCCCSLTARAANSCCCHESSKGSSHSCCSKKSKGVETSFKSCNCQPDDTTGLLVVKDPRIANREHYALFKIEFQATVHARNLRAIWHRAVELPPPKA